MRTLSVFLALLFLTGAQARYFWQHDTPHRTHLEHLHDLWQGYLHSAQEAVKEAVAQFDDSAVGQELSLNVGEKLEAAMVVLREIREQVSPELQEIITEVKTGWQSLKEEMTKDVEGIKAQIQPFVQKFKQNMRTEIANYLQQVKSASQELQQVAQEKLNPLAEAFRDKVRTNVDDFRKDMAPYTKQLEQLIHDKAQVLQEKGLTELTELQTELQQHLSSLREKYRPLWENAQEEWNSFLETAKSNWVGLFLIVKTPEQLAEQESS